MSLYQIHGTNQASIIKSKQHLKKTYSLQRGRIHKITKIYIYFRL